MSLLLDGRVIRCGMAALLAGSFLLISGCAQPGGPRSAEGTACLQDEPAVGQEEMKEARAEVPAPASSTQQMTASRPGDKGPAPEPVQLLDPMDEASHLNFQIHDMAVQLLENFSGELVPEYPIAVATFVDLNDLYRTSPYGRYVAEQLMGELQRAGFQVVELRRTDSILIKERYGEYGLSRQVREIARDSKAHYVLVGTYVTRGGYLFTNARLISSSTNTVASSALKIMRRDHLLDRMLWPSAAPVRQKAIKVPIKQWGELTDVQVLSGS